VDDPLTLPFVASTDAAWFRFHCTRSEGLDGRLDEINFWQPQAQRPMARMRPGLPVFFRLKSPNNAIAGYGFFPHFMLLGLADRVGFKQR